MFQVSRIMPASTDVHGNKQKNCVDNFSYLNFIKTLINNSCTQTPTPTLTPIPLNLTTTPTNLPHPI